MNPIRLFLPLLILCVLCEVASTQPTVDILKIRRDYHFPTAYEDPGAAGADERSMVQYNIDWLLPPEIGKSGNRLLIGGQYAKFEFRSHTQDEINQKAHLQWLEFHLGYLHNWKDSERKHSTQFLYIPKWSTDGKLFTKDAFQWGGSLLHQWQFRDHVRVGVGAFAFKESFGWYVVPSFSLDWRMRNNWFVHGTLLGKMQISKVLNDKFEVGFSYWGPGNTLNTVQLPGSYVRIVKGLYSLWKLDFTFYFSKLKFVGSDANTYVRFTLGHTFDRSFDLHAANDDLVRDGIFYPYKDGPIFSVALALRVLD